jgi:hypothetical protein
MQRAGLAVLSCSLRAAERLLGARREVQEQLGSAKSEGEAVSVLLRLLAAERGI